MFFWHSNFDGISRRNIGIGWNFAANVEFGERRLDDVCSLNSTKLLEHLDRPWRDWVYLQIYIYVCMMLLYDIVIFGTQFKMTLNVVFLSVEVTKNHRKNPCILHQGFLFVLVVCICLAILLLHTAVRHEQEICLHACMACLHYRCQA